MANLKTSEFEVDEAALLEMIGKDFEQSENQ